MSHTRTPMGTVAEIKQRLEVDRAAHKMIACPDCGATWRVPENESFRYHSCPPADESPIEGVPV